MANAIQVSANTNDKITRALSPAFAAAKKIGNLVRQAKGVAGIGQEAVEAGGQIGRNTKQIADSQKANQKVQGSYKKGGKVKKTGIYRLHKGERVLNAKQTKKFGKKGMSAVLAGKKDADGDND